jgi:hypothetical protein
MTGAVHRAINYYVAKRDRSPVGEAFRQLSQDAGEGRGAEITPAGDRPRDRVVIALVALILVLIGLGILALFRGWLP